MTLRWNCQRDGCYRDDCVPDWGFLTGCFLRGCVPSDIDGFVELNGFFLYLEKKGSGIPIPRAQSIAARRRVLDGKSAFLFLWGDRDDIEEMQAIQRGEDTGKVPVTVELVREFCRMWSDAADKRAPASFKAWLESDAPRVAS